MTWQKATQVPLLLLVSILVLGDAGRRCKDCGYRGVGGNIHAPPKGRDNQVRIVWKEKE
jgi:hypothetical protein